MSQLGTVALTVEHDGSVQAIAFSPDSLRFASGGSDSVLRVRTVGIGAPLDVPSDGFVSSIAFSPDGATFAVADFEQVFLRNSSTGSAIWQGPLEPGTLSQHCGLQLGRKVGGGDHRQLVVLCSIARPGELCGGSLSTHH